MAAPMAQAEPQETGEETIRVVHFRDWFGTVTENWICNQALRLEGVDSWIYAIACNDDVRDKIGQLRCLNADLGGWKLQLNRWANRLLRRYPHFWFWLRQDRAQLVHAHFGTCGRYMMRYTTLLGIPLVTSFYGYDAYQLPSSNPRWIGLYKRLFERGQLFLAEGPAMRRRLIDLGCPPEKVIVHHIGVDVSRYPMRKRTPDDSVRLLICGRFVEKKGIPYAVEALQRARAKTETDIRLTIVGGGGDLDEEAKIRLAVERGRLDDCVTFAGMLAHEELIRVAYEHDILLAPSVTAANGDAEGGFPVILTEAQAMGMPVIGSDHCDIPHLVQDGKSGWIVPQHDVEALADRIVHMAGHRQLWVQMGAAGRSHVEAEYDITSLNARLVDIYVDLVTRNKRRS